ncbi:MAG TPA: efflux RND transporter periplasmic adaptor subunit [Flavipsychrobacter sp.]
MRFIWILILLAAASCADDKKETPAADTTTETETVVTLTEEQYKNADIETGSISRRNIAAVLKVNGKIEVPPQNMISVSFPLGGYLKSTKLLPGAHVSKGEVIAVMEDQQYIQLQQDYLSAKARQLYLENEYRRQQELNKSKASSDKVYQQAEADYNSNRIMISALEQKLRLIGVNTTQLDETNISRTVNIYAPVSGFVSSVNVNVGKYVTPADVMFELVDPTDVHLLLTVFEKDISRLFIGQKLTAYTNNEPDKKHTGKIVLIGKDVAADRTIPVHCHFDTYDKALVPGMYMNAEVRVDEKDALVVPGDAVVRYGDKEYIFVVKADRTYEMTEVTSSSTDNGYVAISWTNDDNTNKKVVTTNAYTLLMMLKNKSE